jgi:SAM-dependent methyltransferase
MKHTRQQVAANSDSVHFFNKDKNMKSKEHDKTIIKSISDLITVIRIELGASILPKFKPSSDANEVLDQFYIACKSIEAPCVLELGTSRSIAERSTLHTHWVPHAFRYLGIDIIPGDDVDLVADVHRLTQVTGEEQYDVIISCSSFEHFKYPHLAAHEIMKALRVGGLLFIQTHQSFPLHAYPHDYFRFSREAMAGLFGSKNGFQVIATAYEFPSRIFAGRDHQSHYIRTQHMHSFLNVCLFGKKVERTPSEYVYEYDALA